jgi:hypothetical protein
MMRTIFERFLTDETGATAIEYGSSLNNVFNSVNTSLK